MVTNPVAGVGHSADKLKGFQMMHVGMLRARTFAVIAGLVTIVLAAGSWSPVSATSTSGPISLSSVHWIFYKEDFNHLRAEAPGLIRQIIASPGTYVLEHRQGGPPLPPQVIPAEMFFSSAELRAAINHHRMIPGVKFVVDDLEALGIAPAVEQQEPIPAMKELQGLAHQQRTV